MTKCKCLTAPFIHLGYFAKFSSSLMGSCFVYAFIIIKAIDLKCQTIGSVKVTAPAEKTSMIFTFWKSEKLTISHVACTKHY